MQSSTNGCCDHSRAEAPSRLVGVIGPKPKIEPEPMPYAPGEGAYGAVDAGLLRTKPGEVLDLAVMGRTVEICLDLAPASEPIAVLLPWARYRELIEMRDRIAAITTGFQPQRTG